MAESGTLRANLSVYALLFLNGLLWGLIMVADAEVVWALDRRGHGSLGVIAFWIVIPALMFVISIGVPLWLSAKNRRHGALRLSSLCLFLWFIYFLMQVPFRAI